MLCFARASARILHQPGLVPAIERTSSRCIAAAVRHDAYHDDAFDFSLLKKGGKIGIDEGIIGVLVHYRRL